MSQRIIALSGYSRAGKDTAADGLVAKLRGVKVALADPVKRIAREVFDFSMEQLWGPSENRDALDRRYPRSHGPWSPLDLEPDAPSPTFLRGEPVLRWRCDCCGLVVLTQGADVPDQEVVSAPCFLTPRHALRTLGDEWGRGCYRETWAQHALRTAQQILVHGRGYEQVGGIGKLGWADGDEPEIVVVPDVRYANELGCLIREGEAIAIRIRRPGLDAPSVAHASESEQASIPDHAFDAVVVNDGMPEELIARVMRAIGDVRGGTG